jgi:hypothetical protein
MVVASSLVFSPLGFDYSAIVARFYHPRPDTIVMVVARSRISVVESAGESNA